MEDLFKYIYNAYYAVPGVAIWTIFVVKAINLVWDNNVHDQILAALVSIGFSLVVVNYALPWQLIVLQVAASYALAALSYKYIGTWFIDRFFEALKKRLEKVFKKQEDKDADPTS